MVAIRSCSDLIAIDAHRDQYLLLTENPWILGMTIKFDELFFQNIQSMFNTNANRCICEISLLMTRVTQILTLFQLQRLLRL